MDRAGQIAAALPREKNPAETAMVCNLIPINAIESPIFPNKIGHLRPSVLLVTTDLYLDVGGGQTVYRKLIGDTPDVDFHYFCERENVNSFRPANAFAVPLLQPRRNLKSSSLLEPPYTINAARDADFFARNVASRHFDIIEFPDYATFGSALPKALHRWGVTWKTLVLAMHGNISKSIELNWGSSGGNALEQVALEKKQFVVADYCYAISEAYAEEWLAKMERDIYILDPIAFADPAPTPIQPRLSSRRPPQLVFAGRLERLKGPDIFVECLSWLDLSLCSKVNIYGDDSLGHNAVSGCRVLHDMIRVRGLIDKVALKPALTQEQLRAVYDSRSILILPSRYDTFNLVALEAAFRGCPIIVPEHLGVSIYLKKNFPELPVFTFDINDVVRLTDIVTDVCKRYDETRASTTAALNMLAVDRRDRTASMSAFYARAASHDTVEARLDPDNYVPRGLTGHRHLPRDLARQFIPGPLRAGAKYFSHLFHPRKVRDYIKSSRLGSASKHDFVTRAELLRRSFRTVGTMPESSDEAIINKLKLLHSPSPSPVFRQTLWLELSRLEMVRGRHDMAATYGLRVLRASADPNRELAEQTVQQLARAGLPLEAEAVHALFLNPDPDAVTRFLVSRETEMKSLMVPTDYELRIDQREPGRSYKISVIVSLFRAAGKLEHFLKRLFRQTAFARGDVEIILVDSGSPDCEAEVFKDRFAGQPHLLFVRSSQRETIQAAWNRGISLAQGDYLALLGVDETLYPEALDILALELDLDPSVDWAMADSLIVNVDSAGAYMNDVMAYSRAGASRDLTFLETCYVSWVGGLYRRNIHDRFGMYDPSFRAAGDTEFKNRVLKNLKVAFVPRLLGLFMNYPEERTTQSPRAELEDMRAWYLHRSVRGVNYLTREHKDEDVFALLRACLRYRKSFRNDMSTDLSMAEALVEELDRRGYQPDLIKPLISDFRQARQYFQRLELMPQITRGAVAAYATEVTAVRNFFSQIEKRHREMFPDITDLRYDIVNDNRYEQHFWPWQSF